MVLYGGPEGAMAQHGGFVERDGQLYGVDEDGKEGPKLSPQWERLTFDLLL